MYVTDVLRLIGENAAAFTNGNYIPTRWIDLNTVKEERNADEIALDIIRGAGLKVTGDEQ